MESTLERLLAELELWRRATSSFARQLFAPPAVEMFFAIMTALMPRESHTGRPHE